ncbi:MAG TPA: restriction endonuclease subunit S [Vicinamibacterales bacterium]|nr:restriction endonuclease subunit S [Vicinamibacterales bacterium]HPW21546.1 restriction endonuclease subunit S [Vicinamibacterales bacterium]
MSALRRFKPYPAYKDSGVEWLGEIPVHWEVKRLKYVAPARVSKLEVKPDDAVYVGLEHVDSWTGRLLLENQPESVESVVGSFKAGDVLIGKLRPYLAKVASPGFDGVCSSEILPLRPSAGCSQSYLMYELLNASYIQWLDALTYGTKMPRVSPDQVGVSFVTVPPVPEQRAIAAFLDRETARIDALMTKKERLLELLQEKRTALITRAVTRGLDPTVPMKDSGVEWLGEIPAHWEAARMWRIGRAVSGGTPAREERAYWDGGIPWVSPKDMKRRVIDSSADTVTEQAVHETGIHLIEPPVVLIVVRGMILAHSFPVACTSVPVTINQDMKALIFRQDIEPFFMAWVFEGIGKALLTAIVEEAAHGTRAIRMDQWRFVTVPVPPRSEQRAIAAFLDRETARIDALIAKVREAIERLKELRTALISAAVTGKIDVREEAIA